MSVLLVLFFCCLFFFKQKTAYEMRISDWSSDVCSSDLEGEAWPMSLPVFLEGRLSLPLIGSPLFIISQPALVIAQCRAGIVGSFPSLNARPSGMFERWLQQLGEALTDRDAPFAVNLIVHKTNSRLEEDLALCVKYRVPIVITSLGARGDVNRAVHSYGGIILPAFTHHSFAPKPIPKGAQPQGTSRGGK